MISPTHMRQQVALIILIVLCHSAAGQNLLPNPGFEQYSACPTDLFQYNRCISWGGRCHGSPDYYNCGYYAQDIIGNIPFGVPDSGSGLMGFSTVSRNWRNTGNYTEGICAQLVHPLRAGHAYRLQFSLRIATLGVTPNLPHPGNELGFGFYFYNGDSPPSWPDTVTFCNAFTPQVSISASAIDTYDRYQRFSFCYTPQRDYDSVYIGAVCTPQSQTLPLNQYYFNLDNLWLAEEPDTPLAVSASATSLCVDSCLRIAIADTSGISEIAWQAPGATGPPVATLPLQLCYGQEGRFPVRLSIRRSDCRLQVWQDTVYVARLPLLPLPDTILCPGQSISVNLAYLHGSTVQWEDGDTAHARIFAQTGLHRVVVQSGGCVIRDEFKVIMRDYCTGEVMVPTAFTPNGDSRNDIFRVISNYVLPNFTLRIYNRWGECVFYQTDYRHGWDGGRQEMGAYFYRIAYEDPFSHEVITMKGDVTLLR